MYANSIPTISNTHLYYPIHYPMNPTPLEENNPSVLLILNRMTGRHASNSMIYMYLCTSGYKWIGCGLNLDWLCPHLTEFVRKQIASELGQSTTNSCIEVDRCTLECNYR